jgi:hypothetical protein
MTTQNLATVSYVAESLGEDGPWDYLIVALVVLSSALLPAIPLILWWMFREPKFRGPALSGTAQVLSLRSIGSMEGNSMVPKIMCRIGLRMAVAGGEPYDLKVWKGVLPWMMYAVRPGSTIPVQVDSSNPRNIRIDLSHPGAPWSQRANINVPAQGYSVNLMNVGAGQVHSAAALLATGQRVMGALKSYAPTGTTPRSLGRTPSRPELLDAPHHRLIIELHFPNLAPMEARTLQPVPPAHAPYLAIGMQLPCAVDPANPQLCVVDWDAISR